MSSEEDFSWVTFDDNEKIVWNGNPKLQRMLGFNFTEYVATNKALYRKTGIITRSVQKIDLGKVQNISFSQGVLGSTFGYGNIEISTAGGSGVEMRFRAIETPKKVQEKINRQTDSEKKQKSSPEDNETMKKILEELKRIRKAVEDK